MNSLLIRLKEPKLWALFIFGSILTIVTPFLGAPLLRVLRNVYGSIPYWILGAAVGIATFIIDPTLSVLLLSMWLMIGIYGEFESRGRGGFWPGAMGVAVAVLISWQMPGWLRAHGIPASESVGDGLEALVKRIESNPEQKSWLETFGVDPNVLLGQVPSMLALAFILSLSFSLMMAPRVATALRVRFDRYVGSGRLLDFKVPDVLVYVFIFSFLFSFLNLGHPWVNTLALNLLQIMVALYFFQGLAVLESAFLLYRVDPIVRLLIYILVVAQLFFLLSLVGLADFWLDIRLRLRRWRFSKKNSQDE